MGPSGPLTLMGVSPNFTTPRYTYYSPLASTEGKGKMPLMKGL